MSNSFSQGTEFNCPKCGQLLEAEIWLVVDTSERPDLLEKMRQGKLHEVVCPGCGYHGQADAPLLVFRHNAEPYVFFSPAQQLTRQQNEELLGWLVQALRESLGNKWQDEWLVNGLPSLERAKLPVALADISDQRARERVLNILTESGELGQTLMRCLNVSSIEEHRLILREHPELYSEEGIKLLARLITVETRLQGKQIMEYILRIHLDCRELGIDKVFAEFVQLSTLVPKELSEDYELAQDGENRYLQTNKVEALNQATSAWQRVLSHQAFAQAEEIFRLAALNRAGGVFLRRYWHDGTIQDLTLALESWQQAMELMPLDSLARPSLLKNLGSGLSERYAHIGQLEDLDKAIEVSEQALALIPADSPGRPGYLSDLGTHLRDRYRRTRRLEDLEKAIQMFEQAVANAPADSPDHPRLLNNLGAGLNDRYASAGRLEDLEKAVQLWKQAVSLAPVNSAGRADYLSNLGVGLSTIFEHTGRLEDLEEGIQMFKQAVVSTPGDSLERPRLLNNLGAGLSEHYTRTGLLEDLEEAIRVYEQLLESTKADSPNYSTFLINYSNLLVYRYMNQGRLDDLEKAIQVSVQVLSKTSPDSIDYATILSNLGNNLRQRYIRQQRLEDLEEAIRLYREAITNISSDSPGRPAILNSLGNSLNTRFERMFMLEDLEDAIQIFKQVVMNTPVDSPNLPMYLNNLGNGLRTRYIQTGRLEDLEEAIQKYRQSSISIPPTMPNYSTYLNNLGSGLRDLYGHTNQLNDLEEAIRIYEQAVLGTPEDSPSHPIYLNNLGNCLRDRYERTKQLEDLEAAKECYEQACNGAESISLEVVLTNWGDWAFERRSWDEACRAYRYSMRAIQRLFQIQFTRKGKESWMREARGIHTLSAYALIKTGDLASALETIESGRARQLGEALERSRHDLELLADPRVGKKDLLERYQAVIDHYSRLSQMVSNVGVVDQSTASLFPQDWIRQLASIQVEIDNVIAEIRQVTGYETFLLSPTVAQIQKQAENAPLVYFLITSAGGLALVVTDENIQAVELPNLTGNSLLQQVIGEKGQDTYIRAFRDWRANPYNELVRENFKLALDQITHWLWDIIMQPIVMKLKTMLQPGAQVILIPSDWLSLLPLHAAWTLDESRPCGRLYALDEFTFTYAPSTLALMRSRHQAQETPSEKLMVVENPDRSLKLSKPAAQAALALFNDATHLPESAASADAVRKAFKDHNVLYFFTHGIARFDEPLESALTLADGPLTLADIFGLKTNRARLAVLSACETGVPSNLELLDEAVSLPSGLMQAGVPGVVGSLWAVLESSTAILMTVFFEQWRKAGFSAPAALRKAQMIVRDAMYNKDAQNYFRASLPEGTMSPTMVADILHKELHINDFDHPFYWAAFTYTGL